MNELQRQAYLQALGVTPWVAQRPLPGARAAELLAWPETDSSPIAQTPAAAAEPVAEAPVDSAPPPADLSAMLKSTTEPKAEEPDREKPAASADKTAEPSSGEPLTLQLVSAGDVVVVLEQADPQAPDLSRDAQQLLANLLKVFRGQSRRLNRFSWPMLDQPEDALAMTFQHFVAHLRGAGKVLLCISEESATRLCAAPRFKPQQWGEQTVLAVSTLDEMLGEPREHKPRSWHAMLENGFAPQDA